MLLVAEFMERWKIHPDCRSSVKRGEMFNVCERKGGLFRKTRGFIGRSQAGLPHSENVGNVMSEQLALFFFSPHFRSQI